MPAGYNTLFEMLDDTTSQLLTLISSLDETELNTIPFRDSWTAAQLAWHVTKSNKGMAQALEMEGVPTNRDPAEGAEKLKKTFLDFTVKFNSPEFILPAEKNYQKEKVVADLQHSIDLLSKARGRVDLTEMINVPIFGETTKLELLYFVLYHTQRHIHQLKNILKSLQLVKAHHHKN